MGPRGSLSLAESTQFLVLMHISLRYILILSSHLHLGLDKNLLPAGVSVKILKVLLFSCPTQYSRFNHPDYIR